MFTQNLKRGFTLIELLVVISIVGALASVVLSSVNVARDKGADAAIKSNLANMRVQAALLFDNDGCYTATPGDCVQLLHFRLHHVVVEIPTISGGVHKLPKRSTLLVELLMEQVLLQGLATRQLTVVFGQS